jgi:hypothetical protein
MVTPCVMVFPSDVACVYIFIWTLDIRLARAASPDIPEDEEVQEPVANKRQRDCRCSRLIYIYNAVACTLAALATHQSGRFGFARVDGHLAYETHRASHAELDRWSWRWATRWWSAVRAAPYSEYIHAVMVNVSS